MDIVVSNCASQEDLKAALTPIMHYFGGGSTEQDLARWSGTIEIPRMQMARENGAVVGGAGAFTFEMTLPGGSTVPSAGVTVVGVLPTHRRRGILKAMMRAQLDDVHRRGEPVAWLWASEETIYRRFGYGLASLAGEIEIPRNATAFERPFESRGVTRIVTEEEALESFAAVYERARPAYPGMFTRTVNWWKLRRLADPESGRAGGGVLNRVLLTIDGEPSGYALYRMHQSLQSGVSTGFLRVIEAIGVTPEATREIWSFLLNVDWIGRIRSSVLPVDHPLFFLLARPRLLNMRLFDALWVRLVDVPKALAARPIGPGMPVIIEVTDSFCPWNEGRYRIGEGRVEKTKSSPDLALEVNALGSVYLGGFSFAQLAEAGVVREVTPGAVARADHLFPRGRAPWCPEIF